MEKNKACLHKLYTAFQQRDAETMLTCYHPEAIINDPVFELYSKEEIRGMWSMLCENAQEFELEFRDIKADEESGSVHWEAKYRFNATNRKVHNMIEASFQFEEGLIIHHQDSFSFYRWSRQALGLPGWLLGWSSFLQNKVQQQARINLKRYVSRKGNS